MPRTCTICRDEKRQEINAALVAGESFRDIARRFATTKDAVARHKEHLSGQLVKAAERREDRRADTLIDQVDALASRTRALLDEVFSDQRQNGQKVQPRDVAAVVREVRETLRRTLPKAVRTARARKGGLARRRALTKAERRAVAQKGAEARNMRLTKTERQEAARKAVQARWAQAKAKR